MRSLILILAVIFAASGISYAKTVSQRVGTLEKKTANHEKRIKKLEKNGKYYSKNGDDSQPYVNPKAPIISYFISATQLDAGERIGIAVTVVVENGAAKPVYAFYGDFLFRDSNGNPFFKYSYIQSEALFTHKRKRVLIPVDATANPRAYLTFLRDKNITVQLLNQTIY